MNGAPVRESQCSERGAPQTQRHPVPAERRRSLRVPARLAFDVYDRCRYLGRFWTRDVSQEGLFLNAAITDTLRNSILSLRFWVDGVERCLRGTAVHGARGRGVGIQLAFWRPGDQSAHAAYRRLIQTDGAWSQAPGRSERPQAL